MWTRVPFVLYTSSLCWLGGLADPTCSSVSDCSLSDLQTAVSALQTSLGLIIASDHHAAAFPVVSEPVLNVSERRPTFFMHGILGSAEAWGELISALSQVFPTSKLIALDLYDLEASLTPLQTQVEGIASRIRATIAAEPDAFSEGYDFVGHSLGGLTLRAVVEEMDDHDVHTLVSLAGVQMGGYCLEYPCPPLNLTKEVVRQLYTPEYQANSFANTYHDINNTAFLQGNVFLPVYNGLLDDEDNQRRKSNFARLKHAVFTGSDDDGIVSPPGSELFDYYRDGDVSTIVPMKEQTVYTQDTFGLRTLDEDGRLSVIKVPGVGHLDWLFNHAVMREYVLPLLGVPPSAAEHVTFVSSPSP